MIKKSFLPIEYSFYDTLFGRSLIASTKRGICAILFESTDAKAIADLKQRFPESVLIHKSISLHKLVVENLAGKTVKEKIPLDLMGTDFQLAVWQALRAIPKGSSATYGGIAKTIGKPKAVRAVGTAIGANPIGYLIPCHRVLKSNGEMGGYRWGIKRKQAMLLSEGVAVKQKIKNK